MKNYTMDFKRSDVAVRLAALDKRTLGDHEGFTRNNDGGWLIPIRDEAGEVVASVSVHFKGKAKRKDAYDSPAPEGQRIAHEIAAQFNRLPQ